MTFAAAAGWSVREAWVVAGSVGASQQAPRWRSRSANGTYVNGARVADVVLTDGDVIQLGRATLTYCRARG